MTYAIPCFLIGMLAGWLICRLTTKGYAAHVCVVKVEDEVLEAEFVSSE